MLKYKEYMSSISQKIFITTKIEKKETKDDFNIKTYDVKVMTFCVGDTLYNVILRTPRNFLETREKNQNFDSSNLPYKFGLIFIKMKQNFFFFLKKKIQNGRFFKMAVFQNRQFSKFFRENFTDWSLGK